MKTNDSASKLELRAAEALRMALSGVSSTKLKEIRHEPSPKHGRVAFAAIVDVFGRCHTLVCEVRSSAHPTKLRAVLDELREDAARIAAGATPVLIASYLSPAAQAVCKASSTGFLDLKGNARIVVGEVFIGKRSMPIHAHKHLAVHPALLQQATEHAGISGGLVSSNLPRVSAGHRGDSTAEITAA